MSKERFIEMVKRLQNENKGKIVLVRNGIFLCGIGKDAVIMNNLLGYKPKRKRIWNLYNRKRRNLWRKSKHYYLIFKK